MDGRPAGLGRFFEKDTEPRRVAGDWQVGRVAFATPSFSAASAKQITCRVLQWYSRGPAPGWLAAAPKGGMVAAPRAAHYISRSPALG